MVEKAAEENQKNSDRKKRFSYKFLLGFAALITPVAYLAGTSFYQGLLKAYEVSPEMFDLSLQDTYIYSFSAAGTLLIEILNILSKVVVTIATNIGFVIVLIFITTLIITVFRKLSRRFQSSEAKVKSFEFMENLVQKLRASDFVDSLALVGTAFYLWIAVIVIVICIPLVWWAVPISAELLGYHQNIEYRERYDNQGCCIASSKNEYSICTSLVSQDGKAVIEGLLITRSSNNFVAFYNGEGASVFELPKGGVLKSLKGKNKCKPNS